MVWGIIIGILVVIIIGWLIAIYNQLVRLRENVRNAMGQIAAQVESRWDALTNLMQATEKYQTYESKTFEKIVNARQNVSERSDVADVNADEQQFNLVLGVVNALAEQYPDLKASHVYQQTMTAVDEFENKVRLSRMVYNDSVTKLNRSIQVFPNFMIAGSMGFSQEKYFENTQGKQEMPQWEKSE
ncbi:MAG TPA: LemA family protein [Weissella thailandensis]|uniref:LemA family protein n=1 Tax=Weissella thailandensis TaxID=89061 RepID=UPI001D5D7F92|nr:LemA family protein [Weissella thailandensis]HJG84225.1 LemA family protein [Weissella thailandensis]